MELDETLSMLRDSAMGFAKPDSERFRARREASDAVDRDKWAEIANQGWLSVMVPESRGGLELGMAAAAVIARQLGVGLFPEPYAAAIQAGVCLAAWQSDAGDAVLERFLTGETVVSLAWQDESGSLELDATTVAADGSVLNGTTRFVSPADGYVVAAKSDQGLGLHYVAAEAAGLSSEMEERADGGASARLTFHGAQAECMARGAAAEGLLREAVDVGCVLTGAELVGNLERMLEMTLEYLRTREQFGVPIGAFQALQHRAVDLWIQGELAKAALDGAVAVFDDPAALARARSAAASALKARATDAALKMGREAIQLHGAIGMTDEYDLGLYFNRALALAAWLGNAAEHRRRYDGLQESA